MKKSETVGTTVMGQQELRIAVSDLLQEAWSEESSERRIEQRHPFFRPVSIQLAYDPAHRISAFAREISPGGIGMLHSMLLEPGECTLSIARSHGQPLRVRTEILWCRPCGEGWYLSGGRFAEVIS